MCISQSMVNFLLDPTGDLPWEEDPTAVDVVHISSEDVRVSECKSVLSFLVYLFEEYHCVNLSYHFCFSVWSKNILNNWHVSWKEHYLSNIVDLLGSTQYDQYICQTNVKGGQLVSKPRSRCTVRLQEIAILYSATQLFINSGRCFTNTGLFREVNPSYNWYIYHMEPITNLCITARMCNPWRPQGEI